jgi:serine phosphatase RsbU (regulator of sigma subunit)
MYCIKIFVRIQNRIFIPTERIRHAMEPSAWNTCFTSYHMNTHNDPNGRLMDVVINHLSGLSPFAIQLRSYLSIVVIAIIDYFTGPYLSMLVFYLIPIVITTWFIGRRAGLSMSIVSALACSIHDVIFFSVDHVHPVASWLLVVWNPIISLSVFFIVTLTLSAMRRAEDEKLRCEFKVAAEVQSRLLPQSFPSMKTLVYRAYCKPTTIVSGDYHDFLLIAPDKLGIAIGDIAGKGISAALLMANLQGLLRSYAPMRCENLPDLMADINSALYQSTDSNKFATLFYGVYDDSKRRLTYVNAGHNAPIVFRRKNMNVTSGNISDQDYFDSPGISSSMDRYEIVRMETGGTVIGAFPNAIYTPHTIQLLSGDILVLFTDGLSDARNFVHEQYGEDRLTSFVAANLHESHTKLHELILNDINLFTGDGIQFDDMTLVVAQVV